MSLNKNACLIPLRLKHLSEDSETSPPNEDEGNDNAPFLDSQVRMAPPDPKSPHLPLSPSNESEIPNIMTNLNNLSVSATEEVNDNEHSQIRTNTEENVEHASPPVTTNDVGNETQDGKPIVSLLLRCSLDTDELLINLFV